MKLTRVVIDNFRSCKRVELNVDRMHALVGANNAGKSTILRALDFFFNPSAKQINEESFWNKDTLLRIRVEAVFTDLTDAEKENLKGYLRDDGTFHVARQASFVQAVEGEANEGEEKVQITQQFSKLFPKVEWLRESVISGPKITEWLKDKAALTINGQSFADFVGDNKVGVWKSKAAEFAALYLKPEDYEDGWEDNPKGYAGVLKGALPCFVLVPAVRDVLDESKVGKTNPFGRLLYAVMNAVTEEKKGEIEAALKDVAKQLNREGGEGRLPGIKDVESKLNDTIKEIFSECDLEIAFETPTFEVLMTSPRLFIDDGFRGLVENKGHGVQRATIFSILRSYAGLVTTSNPKNKRTLVLAIEEPELYMHPQAQRTIRRVFQEIAGGGDQIFFSTHSSYFVDVTYFDEIIRVEGYVEVKEGKKTLLTKTWQLPMQAMVDDEIARHPHLKGKVTGDSMREYYSHAYNPTRNEGFFAKRVILVEGDTEEYALPIYADALSLPLDLHGISVVQCGGKGAMDRLYRIFNELGIPCYMLFDYDKNNTEVAIIDKSKELLALAGEQTGVPAQTLISDDIACFPEKWETTLQAEIPDNSDILGRARALLGKDAGKPLVARYTARELASRTPPSVPATIQAILQKAVAVKWRKSCLAKP